MAKATALLFFLGALLLCNLQGGDAQQGCRASDISFTVNKTRLAYNGQPEYTVTFQTECPCPMAMVHVTCDGLDGSAEPLDPSMVEVDDGMCVLKQPIVGGKPYEFKYALAAPVNFRVFSAHPEC